MRDLAGELLAQLAEAFAEAKLAHVLIGGHATTMLTPTAMAMVEPGYLWSVRRRATVAGLTRDR